MVRRNKTTEAEFKIDMEKSGPAGKKTSTTVNAANSQDALRKAKQGDPTQYDDVAVKKNDNSFSPKTTPKTVPSSTPKTGMSETGKPTKKKTTNKSSAKIDPNSFEIIKGFKAENYSYPYCLVLPESFRPVLDRVVSLKKTNITEGRSKGRISLLIEDKESMNIFMEKMLGFFNGKDFKKRDLSKNIIDGIVRSIK